MHAHSCFVTLTYDQDHHPADGSLSTRHFRYFLKRLREAVAPLRFRYFGCGEYGEQTWRPHYHLALFGIPPDLPAISQAWQKGFTMAGPLTPQSMAYVAGYVTKKMTRPDDSRLSGRAPEFARMSLRPGIGAHSMADVANALTTCHGAKLVAQLEDVPTTLAHGRQSMPLGRYLRTKLRAEVGIDQSQANNSRLVKAHREEMHQLRQALGRALFSLPSVHTDHVKVAQVEARARIWRKNETL